MTQSRRHPNVVNLDEVATDEVGQGDFGFRRRRFTLEAAGGRGLGCSHLEVAPGKTAFPFHFHSTQDEAIFILEGTASVRIGADVVHVRAGDYVAFPAGHDTAHALTNTGDVPVRYLAMSGPATAVTVDVVGYPDSKKVAVAAGVDPVKGFRAGSWMMKILKEDQPSLAYYHDEPLAKRGDE
jgi:uncharacterized cupin superfamily protein